MHPDMRSALKKAIENRHMMIPAQSADDRSTTVLVDEIAEMNPDRFFELQQLAVERANQADKHDFEDDCIVFQLAQVGWNKVWESLVQQVQLEQGVS